MLSLFDMTASAMSESFNRMLDVPLSGMMLRRAGFFPVLDDGGRELYFFFGRFGLSFFVWITEGRLTPTVFESPVDVRYTSFV